MAKQIRLIVIIVAIAGMLLLPACGAAATPAEPTLDPNAIYTQAVQTVQAGLTQTAAAQPTATNTPVPTETQAPTATPEPPTATATSGTQLPTLPQPPQSGAATQSGPQPVVATTAALGQAGDHASFGSQSPADNSHFPGLQRVQVFWSLVNTGTTTWTTDYKLTWIGGTQLSGTTSIKVSASTAPGKKAEFYTILVTNEKAGTYVSYWRLFTGGNQPVPGGEVYLKYIVP